MTTKLEPTKFSPSEMNEFYTCPKQWELHKKGVVGLPVDRDHADLGKCTHRAIAEYFKIIGDRPSTENIKNIFTTCFEQEMEKYSLNHLRKRSEQIRDNFISYEIERRRTWSEYRPTLVEEKLEDDSYVAIVDFYSKSHKTLIDWKTGNKRDLTNEDLRQGKIGEILLKKHNHPVEKIFFVALYPNRSFEVPKIGDGFVENERQKMIESIKIKHFPKRGAERNLCPWCDVVLDCQLERECLWLL